MSGHQLLSPTRTIVAAPTIVRVAPKHRNQSRPAIGRVRPSVIMLRGTEWRPSGKRSRVQSGAPSGELRRAAVLKSVLRYGRCTGCGDVVLMTPCSGDFAAISQRLRGPFRWLPCHRGHRPTATGPRRDLLGVDAVRGGIRRSMPSRDDDDCCAGNAFPRGVPPGRRGTRVGRRARRSCTRSRPGCRRAADGARRRASGRAGSGRRHRWVERAGGRVGSRHPPAA